MEGFTMGPAIVIDRMEEIGVHIEAAMHDVGAIPIRTILRKDLNNHPLFTGILNHPGTANTQAVVLTIIYLEVFDC